MGEIISGTVFIKDGIKKAIDYTPAREVHVELKFDVGEGEDGQAKLDRTGVMANAKVNELLGLKAAEAPAKPPAVTKTKAKAEVTAAETSPKTENKSSAVIEEANKPPAEEAKKITDADLLDEVKKARSANKSAENIKKIVNEYAPRLAEIPMDKREEFIKKIEALEAEAKAA